VQKKYDPPALYSMVEPDWHVGATGGTVVWTTSPLLSNVGATQYQPLLKLPLTCVGCAPAGQQPNELSEES